MRRAAATAKLNLALVVGPLGDDGRHEVATVLQRLDLADRISVEPAQQLRVEGFPEDTLVRRALETLADAVGTEARWEARIWKHVPVAAGLGGGSSDAATALRLANETLPEPLPAAALAELAREPRLRRSLLPHLGPAARHGHRQRPDAPRATPGLLGRARPAPRREQTLDGRRLRRL